MDSSTHSYSSSKVPFDLENLAWPAAEAALDSLRRREPFTLIHGVPGSAKSFLAAWLHRRLKEKAPWLLLTPTREEALILQDDLASWLPQVPIHLFPSWEILPQDVETPDPGLIGERQAVFYRLLEGDAGLIIAPLMGALQCTMPPEEWLQHVLVLKKDRDAPPDLRERLIAMGYERVTQVVQLGQFASRGGILDLASPGSPSGPVRLEFFGDTITSIRPLSILNQRSSGHLDEVLVFPAHEVVLDATARQNLKQALRSKVKEGEKGSPSRWAETALELFNRTSQFPGWQWQALGALQKRACLFDYLPQDARILLFEPLAFERKFEELQGRLETCQGQAEEEKSDLFDYLGLFSDITFLRESLEKGRAAGVGQLNQELFNQSAGESCEVPGHSLTPYYGKFSTFASDLKKWLSESRRVLLWCHNRGERERLSELLKEEGVSAKENPLLTLALGEVEQGFALADPPLTVLPDHDLFRRYRGRRHRRTRSVAGGRPLSSLSELSIGDWTVHIDSGICLYRGLTPLAIDGVTRDYIQLEFADNEKIYLPSEQIGLIQRYIGSEGSPVLTKLGGEQWSRAKARVKREIEAVARELMALYSARQVVKKKPLPDDTPWQAEFEDAFLYNLTPGQHQAVVDVKRDLQSDKPMDRLVCGDVGYGKTEVAMRAAFKVVQEKKQAALLVPTTILAQQHYNTFRERMAGYPVEIQALSRFKSRAEQRKILDRVRDGKVDVLIGTHRLLMKDVKFADLGLLIIDEEHRFGVSQKERLKSLKKDVDVLTLTATPIPRTLHMSLSGIREISVIDTPPQNRLSVSVQVSPMDDKLVAEAVRREMNREGQVFYVHNHVKDIERIADRLHATVPEARLAVAHGQLTEHELESIMMDFVDREFDVLVCTSIIESGLDMPNVNTLIVERADCFGLAQLYQLKGRVGRMDRQAYAYFFFPRHASLREMAQKRLEVLQEFSSLGSGMHIAMKDMEIRGAGNVLGTQQHGNMDAIGFDLYSRMLTSEIAHLKGEEAGVDFAPVLSLGVNAYFPGEFIGDEGLKIEFYRRLAEMTEESQAAEVEAELKDRFGPLPPEAQALLKVAAIRPAAKKLGIRRLEAQGGWVELQWHPDLKPGAEKVAKWLKKWPPTRIRFSPKDPNTVSFRVMKEESGPEKQMAAVQELLRSLAPEST
jgi:transcription-repair coupling factor (superfamily II helicase)